MKKIPTHYLASLWQFFPVLRALPSIRWGALKFDGSRCLP